MIFCNSQTCFKPNEQFNNCLKCLEIADTVWHNFLNVICCVCVRVFMKVVFETSSQVRVIRHQVTWKSRPQRMTNYSVPKKFMEGEHAVGCVGSCTILLEECVLIFLITHIVKNAARFCSLCCSEYNAKRKSDLLVALLAHHTSNLLSCDVTLFISLGLSAERYLLLWVLMRVFN